MIARLTIYQRIVALTAGAILLSLGATMLVTFRGPPPVARPLGLDDLSAMIAGRAVGDWRVERTNAASPPPVGQQSLLADFSRAIEGRAVLPTGSVRLFGNPGPLHADRMLRDGFTLAVRRGQGWLVLRAEPRPAILRWYIATFGMMAGVFVILMFPVRRIARTIGDPIARLAAAADKDGDDALATEAQVADAPPEVRALVTAMDAMQRRIREQDRDRAALLRAIAHDLRTPMTRLSFRVDTLPEFQRDRAQADIAEMRTMIAAILDFMDGRREAKLAMVETVSLIESLVEGYEEQGADIQLDGEERLVVLADAALLRRAVQNVIDNALRYAGAARITLRIDGRDALFVVEDVGPGIAPASLPRATEPFWRGEASRARATGGVGLGLAIVRDAMAAMNGTLSILNRPGGGLKVTMALPIAA